MEEKKCIKCGKPVCPDRARYFTPPLSDMCNECRGKTLRLKNYARKNIT